METEKRAYPSDQPLELVSHAVVVMACGGLLCLLYAFSRDPQWVETRFVDGIGAWFTRWLERLTGFVPFSVAEVLSAILGLVLLFYGLNMVGEVLAGRRRVRNALAAAGLYMLSLAAFFGLFFEGVWGVAYARQPAQLRLGLAAPEGAGAVFADTAHLARAIDGLNASYRALHKSDDIGQVTTPRPGLDPDAALELAYAKLGKKLGLPESFSSRRPPVKIPLSSSLFASAGVAGIYVPFTGEAHRVGGPPAFSTIMTAAHEKAHQRFVAFEDEATFFGVLAGWESDEPILRYAAWASAVSYIANTAFFADPEGVRRELARRLPGPARDAEAVQVWWVEHRGQRASSTQTAANDAYLKLNGVADGVTAYARAGDLIALWLDDPRAQAALPAQKSR